MTLAAARQALRSHATTVLIEAPAGCGKTYQAVEAAVDLADELPDGQEVLLLAHTNAAVQEFRRRARARRARVRAMTLDAFALELVAPYAASLGLPMPLRMGQGGVPFAVLAPKLGELLDRCPSITAALAGHYPVVILDEHQDARTDQHRIATLLTATGRSRLRVFGDPMQAIYGFAGEPLIDWAALAATVDTVEALEAPHRWASVPRLGEWIMAAREALRTGAVLPLRSAPPEVEVRFFSDLDDMPNPNSAQVPRSLIRPLHQVMERAIGSVAVLAAHNRHVLGLRRAASRQLTIQEGADLAPAYQALELAEPNQGNPRALALAVVVLLAETATGCDSATRRRLDRCLQPDRIDTRRQHVLLPFLEALQQLYEQPDLATWCEVLGGIGRHPPMGMRIDLPDSFRILGRLRPTPEDDARQMLDDAVRHHREAAIPPLRCVSTIHKAKGQEYDHVVLAHCSRSPFPDNLHSRRLLYVALSRAQRSVLILAPDRAPSPLLGRPRR